MPFSILNDQLSHGWNTTAEMDVVGKYAFKASLLHALTIPSPVIEKIVKRIRKEESNTISSAVTSIITQCARPTLAPKVKRKHIDSEGDDDDDDGRVNGRPKRGRSSAA